MGYQRCFRFPSARHALRAWKATGRELSLPSNICPQVGPLADHFIDVDHRGLAPGTSMYGYRCEPGGPLELDPLMAGWVGAPHSPTTIVSFGLNKILPLTGGGGALLTSDSDLIKDLEAPGFNHHVDFFP